MKHCKKFSGPIFSQNCPPLNPPPSHGSLQQISSPKVLLPSFPDPPSLTDFRWEERGTEDRGIISRFFFSVICDEIFFRFIGSLCDLRSCNQTSLSPSTQVRTLGLFYHISQILICVCLGDHWQFVECWSGFYFHFLLLHDIKTIRLWDCNCQVLCFVKFYSWT